MAVQHLVRNTMLFRHSSTKLSTSPMMRSKIHMCCVDMDNNSTKKKVEKPAELDNYPGKECTYEWQIKVKGKIYDKKPFKFACKKGQVYNWCACGLSRSQPFCDGSHNGPLLRSVLRPVKFIAPEDKEYWFCNCKQTNHRPLCDGSHRDEKVQEKTKYL